MRLKRVNESAPSLVNLHLLSELTEREALQRKAKQFYLRYERAAVTVGLLQLLDRHNVIGVHPHERGTSVVDSSAIKRDKGHAVSIASGLSRPQQRRASRRS